MKNAYIVEPVLAHNLQHTNLSDRQSLLQIFFCFFFWQEKQYTHCSLRKKKKTAPLASLI